MKKSPVVISSAGLSVLAVLLLAAEARADVGLALPEVRDQSLRGFKFEDFVFSPFLGVEGRYSSNYFRQDTSKEGSTRAGILTVVPGFNLYNKAPRRVGLRWALSGNINQYFSDDKRVKNQGRLGVDNFLRAEVFRRSVVGFFVQDRFVRATLPPNYSSTKTYDRNNNHGEVGLQIRPGSAMELDLSYAYNLDIYDDFSALNSYSHEGRFLFLWDLLPKTTLLLDVDYQYRWWQSPLEGSRTNSTPLRVLAGLRGFITTKLAANLRVGYGKGFYKQGPDFSNVIAEAGIGYKPAAFTLLEVGYVRDFTDSYYANYYVGNGAYLRFGQQLFRRFDLRLDARYNYLSYSAFDPSTVAFDNGIKAKANQLERKDHVLTAKVLLMWSIFRYMKFELGYEFEGIFTDFILAYLPKTGRTAYDYGGYVAHQVYGRLTFIY